VTRRFFFHGWRIYRCLHALWSNGCQGCVQIAEKSLARNFHTRAIYLLLIGSLTMLWYSINCTLATACTGEKTLKKKYHLDSWACAKPWTLPIKAKQDNAPLKSHLFWQNFFPCDKSWSHTSLRCFFANVLKFMYVERGPIIWRRLLCCPCIQGQFE